MIVVIHSRVFEIQMHSMTCLYRRLYIAREIILFVWSGRRTSSSRLASSTTVVCKVLCHSSVS